MNGSTLKVPANIHDHRLGSLHAPIVIIEYGDFQSPHCATAAPVLESISKRFFDEVCFIFRHYPQTSRHTNAGVAAVAAEAAALQGKFWQFHHRLLQAQDDFSADNIFEMARLEGLDMKKFLEDLEHEKLAEKVKLDFNGGVRSGVNGTPTLFINGVRFDRVPSFELLEDAINRILGEHRHVS